MEESTKKLYIHFFLYGMKIHQALGAYLTHGGDLT